MGIENIKGVDHIFNRKDVAEGRADVFLIADGSAEYGLVTAETVKGLCT